MNERSDKSDLDWELVRQNMRSTPSERVRWLHASIEFVRKFGGSAGARGRRVVYLESGERIELSDDPKC